MKEKTQIILELFISGETLDFDDITQKLNIKPTNTREKEDYKVKKFAMDTWEYITEPIENEWDLSKAFDTLSSAFKGKEEVIKEICKKYHAEISISIVLHIYADLGVAINLSKENIAFAAGVHAGIDFDIYDYTNEEVIEVEIEDFESKIVQ